MSITLEAIYENGLLRPLTPLDLPDRARVSLAVGAPHDSVRTEWMSESMRSLTALWDNDGDEVFNELLSA